MSITVIGLHKRKEAAAKKSLGLAANDSLPRCGHWSRAKAERLAKAGDPSHLAKGHVCAKCACKQVAGWGTNHLGTGWCRHHELHHSDSMCEKRARSMANEIRKGTPDRVFLYRSGSENLARIQKEAEEAAESVALRDNMILIVDLVQRLLTYIEFGKEGQSEMEDPDNPGQMIPVPNHQYTESYKDGPGPASDMTVLAMLDKMLNTQAKLAKLELEVSSPDYCHMDEVKIFFAQVLRIFETHMPPEEFQAAFKKIMDVEPPMYGKKKKPRR